MDKISKYLNTNLAGEVLSTAAIRKKYARDNSVMQIVPRSVVLPRETADIRKTARLTHQLAEKNQAAVISLTPRGNGSDKVGAAIGNGMVIDLSRHLNNIIDIDAGQGLVHVQAGMELNTLENIVNSHGLTLNFSDYLDYHTIGGAIGSGLDALYGRQNGKLTTNIHELEVVLANGDVIQTRPLSKRELNKKTGQADFEGEIYRRLDGLFEDNAALIESIDDQQLDNLGYSNIARVKTSRGFDLTPLFVGSAGTLGIVSEAIMKISAYPLNQSKSIVAFWKIDDALDAIEHFASLKPVSIELFETAAIKESISAGKKFSFLDVASKKLGAAPELLIVISYNTDKNRQLNRFYKKISQIGEKYGGAVIVSDEQNYHSLYAVREAGDFFMPVGRGQNVPILDGIKMPVVRLKEFKKSLGEIGQQLNFDLALYGSATTDIYNIKVKLDLSQVSDKQRLFKLIDRVSKATSDLGGILCANGNEGRLKTYFAYQHVDSQLLGLYAKVREIFDPLETLNPGVKQPTDLRTLVAQTANDYIPKFLR